MSYLACGGHCTGASIQGSCHKEVCAIIYLILEVIFGVIFFYSQLINIYVYRIQVPKALVEPKQNLCQTSA